MFDKIKESTIGKISDGIQQKTVDLESPVTIDIEVESTSEQIDEAVVEDDNAISALGAIVEEITTRSQENSELSTLIDNEMTRLKNERIAAKNRNVFRKIKPVDNYISKKEVARDDQILQEFKATKQKELSAARSARGKELAKKNKKTIAGLIAGVLVAGSAAGGMSIHSNNVAMAESYDKGVSYILEENYASAADELVGINYNDAEELLGYSYTQMDIDEYKGKPEDFIASLELADDIENTDVKKQYTEAYDEAKAAATVQKEIQSIEIKSIEDFPKDKINTVEKSIGKIKERYRKLIDTENLDTASAVIYALDNNTEAGKLITEIEKLGDVTLDSETELKELRTSYDALSERDKAIIFNYSILTDAEGKYAALKAVNDKKIEEEKAKKEAEEAKKKAEEKAKKEAEEAKKREEEEKKKEAALQAEAEEYATNKTNSMTVYVVTSTGTYHLDGCRHLKRAKSKWESTYGEAKSANRHACETCNPDTYCKRAYESCLNDYLSNHSD